MDRVMRIYNFIKEFWPLIKKNINVPPDSDEQGWYSLIDQANNLYEKHKSDDPEGRFFKNCILAWLDYLNDRNKEGK